MPDDPAPPPGTPDPGTPPRADEDGRWLTTGVGSVSVTSFLSDSGHEIATAVLPSFTTGVLHGSAASLGLIEGISDALTGVAKLVGGPLANDPRRRGRMASGGYLGTALATGAIGFATAVWQVGVLRAVAWSSRGLRSPAKDTLLASLVPPRAYGRAYGLERAGDNLGAVAGPLAAAGLVAWIGIRPALWFAFLPGILAALAITVAAREARRLHAGSGREPIRLRFAGLRGAGLLRPMLPILLFEFGNLAVTLLILRATQLLRTDGRSAAAAASLAILIYAAHNAVGAVVAYAGGHWIDRAGPRVVFAAGSALYVLAYAGFATGSHSWWVLLIFFSLAGAGIGCAETAESALVAQLLPDRLRGSGFGILGAVQAVGDVVATVVVGILYTAVSPTAGFLYAAGWMLLSVLSAGAFVPGRRTGELRDGPKDAPRCRGRGRARGWRNRR
ncbi:MFS transporter [Streptomyces sp. NPDC058280]|uniref:MFS transporter n=1 Tax=Streptomyces sp. NPDC058280 TaxID=3346419 RepID=UPI0036E17302